MPPPPRPVLATGSGAVEVGRLPVHFASGTAQVPLFNRATFGAGDRFAGPAIISQLDATTLVLPDWTGEVDPSGAILLTMQTAH
jgi:N-methylhydantoinase A